MDSAQVDLPPGVKPPIAAQSTSDHSGASVVVTGLFLTIALASVGIKIYARISRRNGVSYDDYSLIVAWVRVLVKLRRTCPVMFLSDSPFRRFFAPSRLSFSVR